MTGLTSSLKYKVAFYVVIALTIAVFIFSLVLVRNNREELLNQVITHSAQLSEVVIRSTRFAMLQNKPSEVDQIIDDVSAHQDIEKVRILSKEGTIIHSSVEKEVGTKVDQEAEACLGCHLDEKSLSEAPMFGRSRFFTSPEGARLLGTTAVIRNEPTCGGAGCHAQTEDNSVLGVLDIVYPLGEIETTLRTNTFTIFGLSFGFIILAGFLVSYLVHRMVYVPLSDLDDGAARLAAGDLEEKIPVRSSDEFGQLAASFNSMTRALRKSRVDLEDWGRTLEEKVEEATKELKVAQAELHVVKNWPR